MATDLATLSVRVTQAGIAETTASLDRLSASAGGASISAASLARSGASAEAITRITGVSAASAAYAVEKFGTAASGAAVQASGLALAEQQVAAATAEVAAASNVGGLGLGRLRQSFATLSAQAVGVSPIFGRLGSTMGSALGISSLGVIAVLAGVAAIAYAWKALESDADKFADKVTETMKRARDARSGAQLGTADDQIAAAQKEVANAQRELTRAQAGSFDGAGAKTGIATVDEADVARQKHILDQALIDLSDWQMKKSQLDYASSLEGASTEARNLALLVSSNHATEAERQRALNLYRSNEAEIAKLGQSQTDNVRRAALIQDDATLRTALHPATTATDDNRLAGIADQIKRMHDEASSFGKDASINARVASIVDELTRLDASFKQQEVSGKLSAAAYQKDAAAITAMKTAAEDAGVALRTAADARAADSIKSEYQAQLELYNAVIDQTGAYHELTAAKQAQHVIDEMAKAIGHDLDDGLQKLIRDTYALRAATDPAKQANEYGAQADAIEAETRAIASGASTRASYSADLAYQNELQKASLVTDSAVRANLVAEITRLHDKTVVLDQLKATTEEQAHVTKTLTDEMQRDFASFFDTILTKGVASFSSLFTTIRNMFMKLFADMLAADVMKKLAGSMAAGIAGMLGMPAPAGAEGVSPSNPSYIPPAPGLAGKAGEALGMAGAGFGVGSMVGGFAQSHGLGIVGAGLGGAAAGAAAGAGIGALGGPIGVVAGAFIGGVAGAVGGLLGFTKSASEAAKALAAYQLAQDSISDSLAQWRAQITGTAADQKAAALLDLQVKYDQIQKTINDTEAGKKHEAQRKLDLAEATDLYEKQRTAIENNTQAWNQNTGAINTVQGYRYESLYYGSMPVVPSPSSGGSSGPPGSTDAQPIVIHLTQNLDGKVVSAVVLKTFQNAAKRSGKGDTTQWSTITSVN